MYLLAIGKPELVENCYRSGLDLLFLKSPFRAYFLFYEPQILAGAIL